MSAKARITKVAADRIGVRQYPTGIVAVVGSPNSGKSTLFNRLTGLRQKTGNYPGVTVERNSGLARVDGAVVELMDLPGMYALSAYSMEERIAADVVLGRMAGIDRPSGIVAVVDATNLYQGLYLLQQLMGLDLPILVALTMTDAAKANGLQIDIDGLRKHLAGVSVCPVVATTGQGMTALGKELVQLPQRAPAKMPEFWPELAEEVKAISADLSSSISRTEIERALIDDSGDIEAQVIDALGANGNERLQEVRTRLFADSPPLAAEARVRYRWVREVLSDVQQQAAVLTTWKTRLIGWLNRPVPGTVGLFVVMATVFQAVFAWATPLMDAIDAGAGSLSALVTEILPAGALASLIADGVIAGVGSVIIFLPQILILFLFIIVLEDSGYLARAAYLMDRAMRSVGLSGQSIIPMISSFACAVPGIMATRVIPNRRDRIATMMAAPFMTCSARLPIYALLIAAFVPPREVGFANLQGLVLFGLYILGIVAGLLTTLMLRKTALYGPKPAFALMLPEFRVPNIRTVLMQLQGRAMVFLRRAGTVIFTVAVCVWALAYYPQSDEVASQLEQQRAQAAVELAGTELDDTYLRLDNEAAAAQLEQSWLGRTGKFIEPVFAPLGWDWKVSAAVVAGFPAREVVIAVMGTVYAVGDSADDATLSGRMRTATRADGSLVYTLPMVFGLLIFYAFCMQCAATLAVMRRETNSLRWPVFAWVYMTSLGYLGALLVYQIGS